jgi:hypothetical protein
MASSGKIDLIEGARVVKRAGYIRELDRIARIKELATNDSGTILDAIDHADLPTDGDQHPDDATLILEDRSIKRVVSASYVEVVLTYRRHFTTADWFAEGTAALQGVTRDTDSGGSFITVTHDGDTQGVTINVEDILEDIFIEIVEDTDTPGTEARAFVNKLNSAIWLGDAAGLWKCTRVEYAPAILTTSPQKWRFRYFFSYDPAGWQPRVTYIDASTGRPPNGLVEGTGAKDVTYYGTVDFNTKFS